MLTRILVLCCAGTLLAVRISAEPLDLERYRLVDLTHAYDKDTVFWPSGPTHFELKQLHYGETDAGFFYAANTFCAPEHGGTHLDAPIHFARDRQTAEQVPLERLVGPVVVIDVSDKAAAERDYRVTPEDVLAFEAKHGRIEAVSMPSSTTFRSSTSRRAASAPYDGKCSFVASVAWPR